MVFGAVTLLALLCIGPVQAYDRDDDVHVVTHKHGNRTVVIHDDDYDHTSFDFKGSSLFIIHRDRDDRIDEEVEITRRYELFINDREIQLDAEQQKLVGEFYEGSRDIYREAKRIGIAGAGIGIKGAALGVDAVFSLANLLKSDYDMEDYEREVERKAEKLEREAEKLERRAEKIEQMADDLERSAELMQRAIPELDRLEWF